MRTIIVLNGEQTKFNFLADDYIIACDGGYKYLEKLNLKPNVCLGDFDSLGYVPKDAIVYPIDKDYTDGELALNYAIKNNLNNLYFICAGGGRDDQFFANVFLLKKAFKSNKKAKVITNLGEIMYGESEVKIQNKVGKTLSIIPISKCFAKKSTGLKYPYDNLTFDVGDTVGLSNMITDVVVTIDIEGEYLIFINK